MNRAEVKPFQNSLVTLRLKVVSFRWNDASYPLGAVPSSVVCIKYKKHGKNSEDWDEIYSLQISENNKQNKSSSGFQKEFDFVPCDSVANECLPSFALLLSCNDPICGDV